MRRTAVLRRFARPKADELRGAAADVEQDDAARLRIDQRRAAGCGQPGFGLAVDDFELDPDLVSHPFEEFEPVARRPAGFGRDQPGASHAAVAHLGAAHPQRLDRAHDRGLAEEARARDALPQPDDARERVDHAKAVARGARHQQAAIVGAEIERGIGRAGQILPTRTASPAVAARMPIGRPPAPPGTTGVPVRHRAEAGRPGLVVHL